MALSRTALTLGTGPDTLVLRVSQDAYRGSAQYTIKVDGRQVGGTLTATAAHDSDVTDTITLRGDWGPGTHRVEVTFLNDLYVPNVGDRNLFIEGATYNGTAVQGATLDMFSGGTKAFSFTDVATAPGPAPQPTPEPTPTPGGSRQFFSDASPWNTQVSAGASFSEVPGLDALMDRHAVGLATWDASWPAVAIYYATDSDPLEEVRWIADSWSPANGGGVKRFGNTASVDESLRAQSRDINPFQMNPYSTQVADRAWNNGGAVDGADYNEWVQTAPLRVRVPADAVPASDGDGLMVIIQPDGRALELYSPIKLNDGTLVSMMYSFTDAENGLGIGAENGRRASMVPNYAGAITDQDIAAGSIEHALAVNVPASMLAEGYTGPALAIDSNDGYSGPLPMGSRLAIPGDINLGTLGLQTQLGRMMAEAAQEYGVYVVDRGGGGITVAAQYAPDSSMLSNYSWPVQQDLETIFRAAQLVQPDQVVWV